MSCLRLHDGDDGSGGESRLRALVGALSVVIATKARSEPSSGGNAKEFRGLRRTCRALRGLHDQAAVRKVFLCSCQWSFGRQPPAPAEVEATVRGLLARGSKPSSVSLTLPCCTSDAKLGERSVLCLLGVLAAGAAPVSRVELGGHTPVTEAVAHAIAALGPTLSHLQYWYCTHKPLNGADDEQAAVEHGGVGSLDAALQLLFQLVGPNLRELELITNDLHWPSHAANPLPYCTALTRLELVCNLGAAGHDDGGLAAESALLGALPSLPALRDLTFEQGAVRPADAAVRQARAASLESCLSPLTALTRLVISLDCQQHAPNYTVAEDGDRDTVYAELARLRSEGRPQEAAALESAVAAEWRALVMAARCMPQLKELRTPALADVADLASLTALTALAVGALVPPKARYDAEGDAPPQPQGNGGAPPAVYGLPPRLSQLTTNAPLSLDIAAALRLSPAVADADDATAAPHPDPSLYASHIMWHSDNLQCWGLAFSAAGRSYLDGEGRLTARAVTDVQSAVSNLKRTFRLLPPLSAAGPSASPAAAGEPSRRLHLLLSAGTARALPPSDDELGNGGDGTHWITWLGPLVVSELQPLLHGLKLTGFALAPRDMLSLGRTLQGLKILNLRGCSYPLPSLTLLRGIKALQELYLRADDWVASHGGGGGGDGDGEGGVLQELQPADVEAAFLGLLAPLSSSDQEEGEEAAALDEQDTGDRERSSVWSTASAVAAAAAAAAMLPALQRLNIECCHVEDVDWLEEALASVREEIVQVRPVYASLDIRWSKE